MAINRWREYEAGKLTPPCVVQHDEVGKEQLVWVWTGEQIVGPLSRNSFDEKSVVEEAVAIAKTPAPEPSKDPQVASLEAELVAVKAELATTQSALTKAQADLAKAKP